jgi:uncharacterized protein (TIGR03435 family)
MRPILLALAAISVYGQEFEVASIKPSPPPDGGRRRFGCRGGPGSDDPGFFTCENISIADLISRAFFLQEYQLNGPDWIQNTRFTISAKLPPEATKEQFCLMLQNLLADRFKLQFHHDTKEIRSYELVVAKGGSKLTKSTGPAAPDETLSRPPGGLKTNADGFPVLPPGRQPAALVQNGRVTIRMIDQTFPQVVDRLSTLIHQPIHDATGITGKYDYTLSWVMDVPGAPVDDNSPTIFQAVQEQLGLKLESKKTSIDILVIDHVEKIPTEN